MEQSTRSEGEAALGSATEHIADVTAENPSPALSTSEPGATVESSAVPREAGLTEKIQALKRV